jgi:hypothetical protein
MADTVIEHEQPECPDCEYRAVVGEERQEDEHDIGAEVALRRPLLCELPRPTCVQVTKQKKEGSP